MLFQLQIIDYELFVTEIHGLENQKNSLSWFEMAASAVHFCNVNKRERPLYMKRTGLFLNLSVLEIDRRQGNLPPVFEKIQKPNSNTPSIKRCKGVYLQKGK
ncbi:MAG: hypothetical protein AAF741_07185 [Bacteroidota bacterium]